MCVTSFAIQAIEPLAKPESCAGCHEMDGAYESWKKSPHYANPSGVAVGCVSCHLPSRENLPSHLTSKVLSGAKDVCVHVFGEYDADVSRKTVRDTMPNERCLHCHANLLAMPSSRPVGIVHQASMDKPDDRAHACVACHDALHGPKRTPAEKPEYEIADNSYCGVCHNNFLDEPFALQHKAAGVGCTACHGDSEGHADDEEHLTPPETIYPKAKINASCTASECHTEEKVKAQIGHRPFYAEASPDRAYCTDCHGMHFIEDRKHSRWDKNTRKLIWKDGHSISEEEAQRLMEAAKASGGM